MHIYIDYEDYYEMKKSIEKYCEENNCSIHNVKLNNMEYPSEIVW